MTSSTPSDDENLLRLLPPIRRARGYHLYDRTGKRYLDLHLGGGRALLGHRPGRVLLELKNLTSRGLLGELPSVFEQRLEKALRTLIPGFPLVRIFASEERLRDRLAPLLGVSRGAPLLDPLTGGTADGPSMVRWRPFLPGAGLPEGPTAVVPLLPFPASFAPVAACIRGIAPGQLPQSDLLSPALLGTLVRSVYELLAVAEYGQSARWGVFDAPWWRRTGPYLVATCKKGEYSELFRRLLEKGILVNPHFPGPSIVPAEFTEGELKPLRQLAETWPA